MAKPFISVGIPTYNSAKYLTKAVESVLQQAYQNYELIIVDNNSIDDTPTIVKAYNDPRLAYRRFDQTVSMAENWNRCLEIAQGEYVCLLHADDLLLPGYLAALAAAVEGDPELGMIYTAARVIDGQEKKLSDLWPHRNSFTKNGKELIGELIFGNNILCPSVTVKKSCYVKTGVFNKNLHYLVDWEMWLRLAAANYRIAYLAKVLACYRVHDSSTTRLNNFANNSKEITEWRQVLDGLFNNSQIKIMFCPTEYELLRRQAYAKTELRIVKNVIKCAVHRDFSEIRGLIRLGWEILFAQPGRPDWGMLNAIPTVIMRQKEIDQS